jgi:hypothetical protein
MFPLRRSRPLLGAIAAGLLACSAPGGAPDGMAKDAAIPAESSTAYDGGGTPRDSGMPADGGVSEVGSSEAGPPSNATASDAFVDTIGLNVHLSYDGTCYDTGFATLVTQLTALGIRHIRDGLVDTTSQTYYDRLNQLGQAGIHATLITSPTQTAALLLTYPSRVPDSLEAYESPNEPDLNEGADWVATTQAFQKTLYQTIKGNAATKDFPVLGPSVTSEQGDTEVGDLSADLDYGNMHNYFGGFNPGTGGWGATDKFGTYGSISWSMNIMAQVSGTKPIITTETGWGDGTAANEVPAAVKARYVTRLFLEQYQHGVVRTIEYQFCDNTGDATDYGLVASDMTPKPAYVALKSLIGALADPGPPFAGTFLDYSLTGEDADGGASGDGGLPSSVHTLLFQKRSGVFELAVWLEAQGWNPNATPPAAIAVAPVTVGLDVATHLASATLGTIDDSGNLASAPLALTGGRASLTVTDHVSIVELAPAP